MYIHRMCTLYLVTDPWLARADHVHVHVCTIIHSHRDYYKHVPPTSMTGHLPHVKILRPSCLFPLDNTYMCIIDEISFGGWPTHPPSFIIACIQLFMWGVHAVSHTHTSWQSWTSFMESLKCPQATCTCTCMIPCRELKESSYYLMHDLAFFGIMGGGRG